MSFVTKKEFEGAIAILERALKNNQIVYAYNEANAVKMKVLLFSDNEITFDIFKLSQTSFIAPDLAVKERLHIVRQELKKQQEETNKNQKTLESLEKEEQKLAKLLPTLKE